MQRAFAGELVGLGDGLGTTDGLGEGEGESAAWLDGVGDAAGAFASFGWQAVAAMTSIAKDAQPRALIK